MKKEGESRHHLISGSLQGFSVSPPTDTPLLWRSRKRSGNKLSTDEVTVAEAGDKTAIQQEDVKMQEQMLDSMRNAVVSKRRKALFEPLEPIRNVNGKRRPSAESLLPPPDFDSASYPRGWLIGKKRKLVNVDVVESMRRIAIQEMNRKDREIDGLNEQLGEDSRLLEHLQLQLLEEKRKRVEVERENATLQDQIAMLMNMMEENEPFGEGGQEEEES